VTVRQYQAIEWVGNTTGFLRLIDQTRLPTEFVYVDCRQVEEAWEAIKSLRVRGAPAIGIAAAYAVVLGLQSVDDQDEKRFAERLEELHQYLSDSRPTAVNLFWALNRIRATYYQARSTMDLAAIRARLLEEAHLILAEDRQMCRAIGQHGLPLLAGVSGVLTHCNTGGLATAEYGTALSLFFTAQDHGQPLHVFMDETRPLLQGARLTAWELMQRGIDATLICDSMAAQVMKEGKVQAVVTGADRIAANGDSANKIGTYSLAVLARAHQIPFYIAAPSSTFDLDIDSGEQIPIELRNSEEITHAFGKQTAPTGVKVYNPAFDVTPAELISAIITEKGLIQPVSTAAISRLLKSE